MSFSKIKKRNKNKNVEEKEKSRKVENYLKYISQMRSVPKLKKKKPNLSKSANKSRSRINDTGIQTSHTKPPVRDYLKEQYKVAKKS